MEQAELVTLLRYLTDWYAREDAKAFRPQGMDAAANIAVVIDQRIRGGETFDLRILAARLPLQQNLLNEINHTDNPALLTPQALYDDQANGRDRNLEILKTNIMEMRSKVHLSISSAPKTDNILE